MEIPVSAGRAASPNESTYRCYLPVLAGFTDLLPRSSRRFDYERFASNRQAALTYCGVSGWRFIGTAEGFASPFGSAKMPGIWMISPADPRLANSS